MRASLGDSLRNAGIEYRHIQIGTQRLRCPRCDRSKRDEALSLLIEDGSAVWHCFRCGWAGSTREKPPRGGRGERGGFPANITRLDRAGAEARAARKARLIWDAAKPSEILHPYLVRKGIAGYGLSRILHFAYSAANSIENALLVPMRDQSGEVVNIQGIGPDGTKRFLAGGKVRGCFALVRHIDKPWRDLGERIAIGEGFASVFSYCRLHPGFRGVAALSASNLPAVARLLRAQFPNAEIVIAADQDVPGARAAGEACIAINALVHVPGFGRAGIVDWNDLEQNYAARA